MKVLACLAVLPVIFTGWLWHTDRSIQSRLAPIASEIAGRPVAVDCQGFIGSLLDAQARGGSVTFGPDGVPEGRIFLTREQCERLRGFDGSAYHSELDCLRTIDWSQPEAIPLGGPCYAKAAPTVYALLVLAHEAYHTTGVMQEALTNCYAIQSMGYAAVRLGAAQDEAVLIARAMAALEPYQSGEYGMPDCVAGAPSDLWPETPEFPTELPVAPAHGKGGVRGIASGAV